jgi:predicted kinase
MRKILLSEPVLIYLFGLPGSGKSFLSRQLAEEYGLAHINSNLILSTLFEQPKYDKNENQIVTGIMDMMADQFLKTGVGVIYDISASRALNRRHLRQLAKYNKAKSIMVWLQTDPATALARSQTRDKRKIDDKHNQPLSQAAFDAQAKIMQQPLDEDPVVVSGKHLYSSQKSAVQKRLIEMGIMSPEATGKKVVKPELVNLVSRAQVQGGWAKRPGRNIMIR